LAAPIARRRRLDLQCFRRRHPVHHQFDGTSRNSQLWTKRDAVGDASDAVATGHLQISVPGGTAHDACTTGNNGVEIVQQIGNIDFQVEAKFDAATGTAGTQGLMALADASHFVRCDIAFDSQGANTYSAYINGPASADHSVYTSFTSAPAYWLRLARAGSTWTCLASIDGLTYTQVNQFSQALSITQIGPWAGNLGLTFTAQVDYFTPYTDTPPPSGFQADDGQAQGATISTCNAAATYTPVSRERPFKSTDGSNLVFVADSPISDSLTSFPSTSFQSGVLHFGDGELGRTRENSGNSGNSGELGTATITPEFETLSVAPTLL
jgi:hypothetical protein